MWINQGHGEIYVDRDPDWAQDRADCGDETDHETDEPDIDIEAALADADRALIEEQAWREQQEARADDLAWGEWNDEGRVSA